MEIAKKLPDISGREKGKTEAITRNVNMVRKSGLHRMLCLYATKSLLSGEGCTQREKKEKQRFSFWL